MGSDPGNENGDSKSTSVHHYHHFPRPIANHLLPSLKHTQKSPKHTAPIGALHKILNTDQGNSQGSSHSTNDPSNLQLPEMNPPSSGRDTDLPSIRDALPMHAQIDLHSLPGPEQQHQQPEEEEKEKEKEEQEDANGDLEN